MDSRRQVAPEEPRRDLSRTIVGVLVAVGGFVHVFLGGLVAPREVVVAGMALYPLAVIEMIRRLRRGDAYALAVPVIVVVLWTALLVVGMTLLGWTP